MGLERTTRRIARIVRRLHLRAESAELLQHGLDVGHAQLQGDLRLCGKSNCQRLAVILELPDRTAPHFVTLVFVTLGGHGLTGLRRLASGCS